MAWVQLMKDPRDLTNVQFSISNSYPIGWELSIGELSIGHLTLRVWRINKKCYAVPFS
jgi:hypothetical protein